MITSFRGMLHARDELLSELIGWLKAQDAGAERFFDPAGDRFACRYEAYLTDPRTEPRKTKWVVELSIRVAG